MQSRLPSCLPGVDLRHTGGACYAVLPLAMQCSIIVLSCTSPGGEFLHIVAFSLTLIGGMVNVDTVWTKAPFKKVYIMRL